METNMNIRYYERELKEMPFDKDFDGELCHATGRELCFSGSPEDSANWWNEYETPEGELVYGR